VALQAKKICNAPGCGVLTYNRYCTKHDKPKYRRARDTRGSSASRGYDYDWQQLRNSFIMHNPLCQHCKAEGKTTAAEDVDHVKPFKGKSDPLRLDWSNLQSLCRKCHRRKTVRDNDSRS